MAWMFTLLGTFDQPYNQAPSLHLALTVILWAAYQPGWFLRSWFVLMGLSTLTTYQHHFIDIPTGIWVGLFCLVIFPEQASGRKGVEIRNRQTRILAAAYFAGFATLVALTSWIQGIAWLLLWPAGSLLIVAGIYWRGRPELFRKRGGQIEPELRILLAPYLACAWLNTRLRRGCRGSQEIREGLWLGRAPLNAAGFASLVDLTAELPVSAQGAHYQNVPMLDLIVPAVSQLEEAVEAIDRAPAPTLVFCALGYSRSAMAVSAWLLAHGHAATVSEAVGMIAARRPGIRLSAAHRERLEEWRQSCTQRQVREFSLQESLPA